MLWMTQALLHTEESRR